MRGIPTFIAFHVATAADRKTFTSAGDCVRYKISFAEVAFAAAISRCPSREIWTQPSTTGNDYRYG